MTKFRLNLSISLILMLVWIGISYYISYKEINSDLIKNVALLVPSLISVFFAVRGIKKGESSMIGNCLIVVSLLPVAGLLLGWLIVYGFYAFAFIAHIFR